MHTTTLLALAMAAATALADFQIYNVQDAYADGLGDSYLNTGFLFFNTEPSCDDVNNADFIAGTDDASSYGVRAEVSDPTQLIGDQDVTLLEWNTDMGHFTIYGMVGPAIKSSASSTDLHHRGFELSDHARRRLTSGRIMRAR